MKTVSTLLLHSDVCFRVVSVDELRIFYLFQLKLLQLSG